MEKQDKKVKKEKVKVEKTKVEKVKAEKVKKTTNKEEKVKKPNIKAEKPKKQEIKGEKISVQQEEREAKKATPINKEIVSLIFKLTVHMNRDECEEVVVKKTEKNLYLVEYNCQKLGFRHKVKELNRSRTGALKRRLEKVEIAKWKSEYLPKIPFLDGFRWDMSIRFADGKRSEKHGMNAIPDNWNEFIKVRDYIIEQLNEKDVL